MTDSLDVQYVTIHGHRRAFVRTGTGPALLLLHGMACDHTTWHDVIPRLAERHTVVAPDLLGHGRSAKPRADYSVAGYANGMRDLLTVLDVDRVSLVGHSLGGGVAMQFAYQYPEMTERMVLVAPGGLGPDVTPLIRSVGLPGSQAVLALLAVPGLRPVVTAALRRVSQTELRGLRDLDEIAGIVEGLGDAETRRALRHIVRASVDMRGQMVTMVDRAYLARDLPMLAIWGSDDPVIPSLHAETFRSVAAHAKVEIFERSGHFPHKDRPERFVSELEGFLSATAPASFSRARWRARLRSGPEGGPGLRSAEPPTVTVV